MTKTSHALILIIVSVYVLGTMILWLSPIAVWIDPMARIMTIGFFGVFVVIVSLSLHSMNKGTSGLSSILDFFASKQERQ